MAYTASNTSLNSGLRGEVDGIEAYTASLKGQAIVSSSTQIQNYDLFALNSNVYNGTGSIKAEVAGIESYTASLKAAAIVSSSTQIQNYDVFALNSNLYTSTGSLIGITNGLMAFTAALDSTYATDAQLYQLYQATRSIELTTGSLIGITNGLMAFTAALDNTYATDAQLYQLYQATQSLELLSGSLIGITNGLMAFTAALDSTYATDAQLYQLYAETASIKAEIGGIELYTASLKAASIVSSSTQVQNYDLFALNSNLYNGTGSIKGEIAGIEAYTASLKAAAIVSSSQQIQNYFTFAQTSSANTVFYGNVTASGNLHANQLYIGGATTASGLFGASEAVVQNELGIQFSDAAGTYMRLIANTANSNTAIVVEAFSGAQPPLDLIAGGVTGISVKNDGGVNFVGSPTASIFKIKTAGGGIDFSITSNSSGTTTSELFDDYEYGTFTPILSDAVTGGNTATGTFYGTYTKIGRQVIIGIGTDSITTSGMTAGNVVYIQGLPFACGASQVSPGVCNFYNVDIGDNNAIAWLNSAVSTTALRVLKQSPTTNSALIVSDITSTTAEITLSITYYT